jgi:hypothetical protein
MPGYTDTWCVTLLLSAIEDAPASHAKFIHIFDQLTGM